MEPNKERKMTDRGPRLGSPLLCSLRVRVFAQTRSVFFTFLRYRAACQRTVVIFILRTVCHGMSMWENISHSRIVAFQRTVVMI
jgi:hypothetical protein